MGLEKGRRGGEFVWNASSGPVLPALIVMFPRPSAYFHCFPGRLARPTFHLFKNVDDGAKRKIFWISMEEIRTTMCRLHAGRMFKPAGIYLKRGYETTDWDFYGHLYQIRYALY